LEEFICVEDCPEDNILELNGKCYKNSPVGYKNNGSKLVKCNDCPRGKSNDYLQKITTVITRTAVQLQQNIESHSSHSDYSRDYESRNRSVSSNCKDNRMTERFYFMH
jgi:hypothetical protein